MWATATWAYWPILCDLVERWRIDPRYSHGFLVPAFAAVLLWQRRRQLEEARSPSWWGVPSLVTAAALYLAGAYFYFEWFSYVSLLPALAGLALLSGGRPVLQWAWPGLAFLVFMLPLPFRLEVALAGPLQRLATVASTYALQILGMPALAEGNVILLEDVRIGVVEACSGLSMLLVFFALSTAVALLSPRPLWERGIVVASAAPIAVMANVLRITATGVLHLSVGRRWADLVFHDLSGWLMMPVALGLLYAELWVLSRLFVEPVASRPVPVSFPDLSPRPKSAAGKSATEPAPA